MSQSISFHVVPWYNSEEWNRAFDYLNSGTNAGQEEALEMLLMWKARCPALPSGIESTLGLLQVYVEDRIRNSNNPESNDQLHRLAYSTAIMRFVNHMCDGETERGTSLYKAAKTLGVPDWIVDLRHETAHSSTLPPITLLRDACAMALSWLLDNYWKKHKPYIKDYRSGQKDIYYGDSSITAVVNSCISLGICNLPNLNIKTLGEIPDDNMRESILRDTKELFGNLLNVSDLNSMRITSLIHLIYSHSKRLLQVNDAAKLINEALLGEDSLFLSRELLYFFSASDFKYKNKLYSSYVQCFEVLLYFLHSNDLLLNFLLSLIKITQSPNCGYFKGRLAALWCSEILAALKDCQKFSVKYKRMRIVSDSSKMTLKKLYKKWYPDKADKENNLTLNLLKEAPPELLDVGYIQPFITDYNQHLTYFIRDLLALLEPALPTEVAEKVCALSNLISTPDKFPMSSTSNIFTAEDIRMSYDDVVIENAPDNEDEPQPNNIWKLASREYNWSKIAIGQEPMLNDQEIGQAPLLNANLI